MTKLFLFISSMLIVASGCMSVAITEGENSQITARNFGWSLFNYVPLVCGNANQRSWMPCTFFVNDTHPKVLEHTVTEIATLRNLKVKHTSIKDNSSIFFSFPQCAFMLPIPYFITYRDVTITADLITETEHQATQRSLRLKREMEELLETIPLN